MLNVEFPTWWRDRNLRDVSPVPGNPGLAPAAAGLRQESGYRSGLTHPGTARL